QLRTVQSLVRGRAQGRSEPCAYLVLLRHVADGTGQPAQGRRLPRQGERALRDHRLQGIYRTQGRDRRQGELLTRPLQIKVSSPGLSRRSRLGTQLQCQLNRDGWVKPGHDGLVARFSQI